MFAIFATFESFMQLQESALLASGRVRRGARPDRRACTTAVNIDPRVSAEELLDALDACETDCDQLACLLRFATNDRLPEADMPDVDMPSPSIPAPMHMENTRLTEREAPQSQRLLRDVFGDDDNSHPHLRLMY